MRSSTGSPSRPGDPSLLDGLALLAEVADELVLRTVRDTHTAVGDRVHGVARAATGGTSTVPEVAHRTIAGGVYAGLGLALAALRAGLDRAAATGAGPRLEDDPRGRFLREAVNGLIGDRLAEERPALAIPMSVRMAGRDVALDALAEAFPSATGRVVVFLHGLCESEIAWLRHRDRLGTTYAETLTEQGWTPVMLRANTGLPVRENGVALGSLLDGLVAGWPVPVERITLVGHSMGGLIIRAASAVRGVRWPDLVTDVVTLGTPHLGAPMAAFAAHGSRGLGRLPESAAFGRILDWRSRGIHDLVLGLDDDVPPLPKARYRLVSATLSQAERHPVGHLVGDLLVRPDSAAGRDRRGRELFPGAEVLHLGRSHHFSVLNHPEVARALVRWLA